MQERLMEILVKLLKEIHTTDDVAVKLMDLSEQLRMQGFSDAELNMAFSWLNAQLQTQNITFQDISPSHNSVRVLHPAERLVVTPEAYGYLLHLENIDLIDKDQIEMVIERALASGMNEVTLDDIKVIIASVAFSTEHTDWMSQSVMWSEDERKLKVH